MSTAYSQDQIEAVQLVVDRVSSYQDGATEGTIESELRNGLSEAGIEIGEEDVRRLASAIEDQHGSVDAGSVLA